MVRDDRELLARLSRINQRLGEAVVELVDRQDGGVLPAAGLDELAGHLEAAAAACRERAAHARSGQMTIDV